MHTRHIVKGISIIGHKHPTIHDEHIYIYIYIRSDITSILFIVCTVHEQKTALVRECCLKVKTIYLPSVFLDQSIFNGVRILIFQRLPRVYYVVC